MTRPFLLFRLDRRDGAGAELRDKRISFEGPKEVPYGMRQLWFSDPCGYQLCFRAPA